MKKGLFQTVLNAILLATLFFSTPLFASKLENMERVKQELVPPHLCPNILLSLKELPRLLRCEWRLKKRRLRLLLGLS